MHRPRQDLVITVDKHKVPGVEFEKLAASGKVWEDFFQPRDGERYRYGSTQKTFAPILKKIDDLKHSMRLPERRSILDSLVAEYAHKSVKIENNTLHLSDSIIINKHPDSNFMKQRDISSMSAHDLTKADLPNVAKKAMQSLNTPGIDESEVKSISALIVKDTDSEAICSAGWGKRVKPGDYRQTPISVKSNPLRIFPYHDEVPALMNRFFAWRNINKDGLLHPLILACQATAYFVYIHSFPDGNGRVSRLVFQDALVRREYLPVALPGVGRDDYVRMISLAQDADPSEFVAKVLSAQLGALHTFRSRGSGEGGMEA
ncbi:fic/DOC family protein [Podospora appendiculata]|uniref:Fic/DOC family protein n=1 Tax=Podospora appendiculata TaxID=314037 RepID=A0AAE0XA39_9PEZI|nr:fic/DOC family protein [Podospora appendiculata]